MPCLRLDVAVCDQALRGLEALHGPPGLVPEAARHRNRLAGAPQVLLRPDDEVAAAALREHRIVAAGSVDAPHAGVDVTSERPPLTFVGLLPRPPADTAEAVRDRHPAEALDLADRWIVVSLADRADRSPIEADASRLVP